MNEVDFFMYMIYYRLVLTNKHISIYTRRAALECYIEPILIYGWETCIISKQAVTKGSGGIKNVVSIENAAKLIDCKEII